MLSSEVPCPCQNPSSMIIRYRIERKIIAARRDFKKSQVLKVLKDKNIKDHLFQQRLSQLCQHTEINYQSARWVFNLVVWFMQQKVIHFSDVAINWGLRQGPCQYVASQYKTRGSGATKNTDALSSQL